MRFIEHSETIIENNSLPTIPCFLKRSGKEGFQFCSNFFFSWNRIGKMQIRILLWIVLPIVKRILLLLLVMILFWKKRWNWNKSKGFLCLKSKFLGHWCDSTYMVLRLSDISSKTGKKCVFCFYGVFELMSDSLLTI